MLIWLWRVAQVHLKWIFLLALILVFPAVSQAEDLLDIYKIALESDPQYKSAKATYEATLEVRPQAQAQLFLPSVSLKADVSGNFQDISGTRFGVGGRQEFMSGGYRLDLTQPVYHHDRYVLLKQADSRIQAAEADLSAAQEELLLRAAERYFNVLAAEDNLTFAEAEKNALESQLTQAKERFDVGLIAITDVQEAQAGYDLAVAQEIEARNQVDNAREALREVTGEYHQDLVALGDGVPLVGPEPADISQWTARALEQNRRVTAARLNADTAEKEIRLQSAGHLPTLDLVGGHGFATTGGQFPRDVDDSSVGLQLNLPIYEGGQVNSRTREAQHRHEAALEQFEQARRGVQRQGSEAYLGVISGISRVKALKQAIVSNETAVEATRAGFEVGTRTAVDIVTSERGLFQARRDYARARYDYILNSLRLKQAAGILAMEDVVKVNGWLKPSSAKKRN